MSRKGSLESLSPSHETKKLWTNVNPSTLNNRALASNPKGQQWSGSQGQGQNIVRPTKTTLLRHHQVLLNDEQKEKDKVHGILQGNANFDLASWKRSQEAVREREEVALQAKRRLKAKLAYHKAIAASSAMIQSKLEAAESVRDEGRRLREEVEAEQEVERERRRLLAAEVQNEAAQCRELVEKLQLEKRRQAKTLKQETLKLKEEARRKEMEEMITRKEKIQQIQASKFALRQVNTHSLSPAAFLGALGSPDVEIRLKLTKEAQRAELEQKRQKVQQDKKERDKKLEEVRKRLEGRVAQRSLTRELQGKFKPCNNSVRPLGTLEQDEEMKALAKELEKLKMTQGSSGSGKSRSVLNLSATSTGGGNTCDGLPKYYQPHSRTMFL